jgi:thiol:disulfide interchange protein DsbD
MILLRGLRLPAYLLLFLTVPLAAAGALPGGHGFSSSTGKFPPADQVFQHQVSANDDGTWTVSWDIKSGFYLYKKRLKVSGADAPVKSVDYPEPSKTIDDPNFGESAVYLDHVDVRVDPGQASRLKLSWQGCAEAGLCYPPQSAKLDVGGAGDDSGSPAAGGASAAASQANAGTDVSGGAQDQNLSARLAGGNGLWALLTFFGLGVLLSFTPCVLPMIPILSSVVVGSHARRGRALSLSAAFVVVMAATYAVLGAAAALAGANLQATLQTPWLIVPLALLLAVLAFAMFGLYELQLPARLRAPLDRLNQRQHGGSLVGAGFMGLLSALLVSPCMTAPLAGALIYIADSGNAAFGGLALFTLGLGMGAPLIVLALLGTRLLPRPGAWMNAVKGAFGFILLGTAVYFLGRILPGHVVLVLWGALALALGLVLWRQTLATLASPALGVLRTAALLAMLWGALMVVGGAAGGDRLLQPLQPLTAGPRAASAQSAETSGVQFKHVASKHDLHKEVQYAAERGRWTLVDFSADWCVSCKVMDKEVFGDPRVEQALGDVHTVLADVTDNDGDDAALMKKFRVVGPPTVLLFGPDGKERRGQRMVGEVSARQFLEHLGAVGIVSGAGGG